MAASNSIVSIVNVRKEYNLGKTIVPALQSVSLEVAEGDFISIAGPSGSGKTTLLNLIGCVDAADARARCAIAGADTRKLSRAAAHRAAPAHHRLHLPELQPGAGALASSRTWSSPCCCSAR